MTDTRKIRQSTARELLRHFPMTEEEKHLFVLSEKRVDKIRSIEKYKKARIVVKITQSEACIAGHKRGEKIYFNSMGCLLVEEESKPICARLISKIGYRIIMLQDRMADYTGNYIGNGDFTGDIIEVKLSCYGASFPNGDCGQVKMSVSMEGICNEPNTNEG